MIHPVALHTLKKRPIRNKLRLDVNPETGAAKDMQDFVHALLFPNIRMVLHEKMLDRP